jgi:hypothetical protein
MTSLGQQATHSLHRFGAPGWRPLLAVAALVLAVHWLVLQASAAHLGIRPEIEAADKTLPTLITRNIEPAPQAVTAPTPPVVARQAVKTAQKRLKIPLNRPPAQEMQVQAAPETVAASEPLPPPQPSPLPPEAEVATDSPVPSTPTQAAVMQPSGPQTTQVTAIRLPGSVRLDYSVVGLSKKLTYQAAAELTWQTDGDSYQAMMKVSAFLIGSRSMTSVGKITARGLAPTRFADKFRSELTAHFEPEKGKVSFSANTPDVPWEAGVQDRVSVFLQLGGMLAARPQNFPPGSIVSFLTVGPKGADTWSFVIQDEETLDVMGAPMAALKLIRKPRKEYDQKVEIWFAPSLGYLPVRSRITQDSGDFIDQKLTDIVKNL